MKKLLLFSVCMAILCSCNSNQKKAERLVKQYMKENIDDYKSYEPIKFSELEPILVKEQAEKVLKVAIDHKKSREDYIATTHYLDSTQLKEQLAYIASIDADIDSLKRVCDAASVDDIYGWCFEHSYRSANKIGAMEKKTEIFYFNRDITEIQ